MIKRCLIAAFLLVLLTAVSSAQSLGLGLGIPKSVPSAGGYAGIANLTGIPIYLQYYRLSCLQGGDSAKICEVYSTANSPDHGRRWLQWQRLQRYDRELPRHADNACWGSSIVQLHLRYAEACAPRPSMSNSGA